MTEGDIEWRRELRHTWPTLGVPRAPELATSSLTGTSGAHALLAAVDAAGSRHFLVEIGEGAGPPPVADKASRYVQIGSRILTVAGVDSRYVDVVCTRLDLFDMFDDIVADMIDEVIVAADPAIACSTVLGRWRELLRKGRPPLSEQRARGLFAELAILDRLLDLDPALPISQVWTGPDREPHDFELTGHSLEVKALGADKPVVRVHGLSQLEPKDGKNLHLVAVEVQEDEDGQRLPDLARAVLAKSGSHRELSSALARAGYVRGAGDDTAFRKYSVTATYALPVTPSFPCLTPSSLSQGTPPRGVDNISYDLDLLESLASALSAEAFARLLAEGVAGA